MGGAVIEPMLTMASLFDRIGGWQLAAVRNGVKPIWSSEIEKFPMECTKKHFPDTIQLGDIRNIENPPHVDIVCAGSPCQDLSVAGSREGLKGERSGLFHRAIEFVRQTMLNGDPAAMTWDSIEEIKNREILEIVACTNKDEEAVMLVTIENE